MDFQGYDAEELYAIYNLFLNSDAYLYDERLPENTPDLLYEFASLDKEEREAELLELSARANFVAYANQLGNADMVDALMKVANDMSKMSKYELEPIKHMDASEIEAALNKESSEISFPSVEPVEEKQEVM